MMSDQTKSRMRDFSEDIDDMFNEALMEDDPDEAWAKTAGTKDEKVDVSSESESESKEKKTKKNKRKKKRKKN